jgi:hypothetical protein
VHDPRKLIGRPALLGIAGILALGLIAAVGFLVAAPSPTSSASTLPSQLSDQEFWRLSTEMSEPSGTFSRENLTSNELLFQEVIPELVERTGGGDVYLGVGPEQNFTYIAAMRPALAIIFDIRRDNMLLHLMYKAIFELTDNRADFLSMLFSRPRPAGLGRESTADELFSAFDRTPADDAFYLRNLKAISVHLTTTHGWPVSTADLASIESAYDAFHFRGIAIRFSPTYADLMTATDQNGFQRSYLATEENFLTLRALQTKNLVVPVVGDFGGPKAIRAVGTYLKSHGAKVAAFYLSNVEQYLYQDGKWGAFCRNVATLPLDESSTFIRSSNRGRRGVLGGSVLQRRQFAFGGGFVSSLGEMAVEVEGCR